jgi:hypothetical protein
MAQSVSRWPPTAEARVLSRVQFMWDLLWTKWHWDTFFPEYFGFPLSISFHRRCITRKRTKIIIIVIFITGLHNKPHGCSASLASATGLFNTKKVSNVMLSIRATAETDVLLKVCQPRVYYRSLNIALNCMEYKNAIHQIT